jgi:nitroreductase
MSLLTPELLRELVAEARLAPSVHNIQPTRWRLRADGRLELVDDTAVRAPVADPSGHDVLISHGAALEGMSLALARRGLSIAEVTMAEPQPSQRYAPLRVLGVGGAKAGVTAPDPLLAGVSRRMSWRGTFLASPGDDAVLDLIAAGRDDVICLRDRHALGEVAVWADLAELSFVRDEGFRRELLTWMRLSPRHPRYLQDGLNRAALAMTTVEAAGAGFVLGGLFPALDRLGLAASLLSDRAKTASAAGIVLFCRPKGEDPLISGRHFYRVWLAIDRAGLAACPISALADHPGFNAKLGTLGQIGEGLRLVNVFRVGRPSNPLAPRHFRLAVDRLIV